MSTMEVQLVSKTKDENFEAIYVALAAGLRQSSIRDDPLKVICEFEGEKRVMQLQHPVAFEDLLESVTCFGAGLAIQVQDNGKGYMTLRDQTDLDQILVCLDHDSRPKVLHIRLIRDGTTAVAPKSPLPRDAPGSPIPSHLLEPFHENPLV